MRRKRVHYIKNQIIGLYCCLIKCILFNTNRIALVLKDKESFDKMYDYLLVKDIQNKYSKNLKKCIIHKHRIDFYFTNDSILRIRYFLKDNSYECCLGVRLHEVYTTGDPSHSRDIILNSLCTFPRMKKRKEENKNV
jgi:hypothetical protein